MFRFVSLDLFTIIGVYLGWTFLQRILETMKLLQCSTAKTSKTLLELFC